MVGKLFVGNLALTYNVHGDLFLSSPEQRIPSNVAFKVMVQICGK